MMNLLCADNTGTCGVRLTPYERNSLQKRLHEIEVALGHSNWTPKQLAALYDERADMQRKLAAAAGQ